MAGAKHARHWMSLIMLSKLIGVQLISMDNTSMTIKLGDKKYVLEFHEDDGGCCGYASFIGELEYQKEDENNPVITDIRYDDSGITYGGDMMTVTFYGESKSIAQLEGVCGSGSGWGYGATASIVCKELDIDEILASW